MSHRRHISVWLLLSVIVAGGEGLGRPCTGCSRVFNKGSIGVDNPLDETYRDFLDTYKGYALSPGRDVQFSVSTSF